MRRRRGFTLVELLVATLLVAIVGAAAYALLITSQRLSRRQVEQSSLQDNVRVGALLLSAELREIGYDAAVGADLLQIAADRIRFRAMRGVGFTCDLTSTAMRVRKPILGYGTLPAAGDTLLYFVERAPNVAIDDDWIPVPIAAVDLNATCPDGATALRLTVGGSYGAHFLAGDLAVGGPVRFYEVMEVGLYRADGKSWLGARSVSANEHAYQPVLGPLADGNGLQFTYYNVADAVVPVTGDRNTIRTIEVDLRGRSDTPVWTSDGHMKVDALDLKTGVALRNTLRP